ncbi:MAG: L-fucose:H+ symporter permease [Dysgonamonadaceae bacterium]|jgi:FHS family L-fucose permease-like MFS transporter|nr:L-fucose:H+ symporter permease [Dysgonamonadaceae bacterium]
MSTPKSEKHIFSSPSGGSYLFAFILVTSLFALWGFANDITNPMVAAFKKILLITNFESSLVQFAFYGGYCFMAIPAALFIRRFNYKSGIFVGLALYAAGCLLFIPAGNAMVFEAFLVAYFVMTCGLSFLETTSNPYVLAMGPEESATRRLNFAQAFNPMGSIAGMLIAKEFILKRLSEETEEQLQVMKGVDPEGFFAIRQADLNTVGTPYLILGLVVLCFLVLFIAARLPNIVSDNSEGNSIGRTVRCLLGNRRYVLAVFAQAFYVGVQIMVWTFIIQYAESELSMSKSDAQGYNIVAMAIFVSSRFICTYLLKYIRPSLLLMILAFGGGFFTLGAIFIKGPVGLYSIVAISACMSLMFPTIYGIALKGMGEEAKLASAGLILAIGGGAVMPPLQGWLIDRATWFGEFLSPVRVSFFLPFLCFVVIAWFGRWCGKRL